RSNITTTSAARRWSRSARSWKPPRRLRCRQPREPRRRRAMREQGTWTRRRAIRVIAAGAGLPLMIAAGRAMAPAGQMFNWQGEVLGAVAELTLWHTDAAFARRTIVKVRGEIERYERIFSLYREDSEISRLNAAGTLAKPSRELRGLVEESQRFSVLSDG